MQFLHNDPRTIIKVSDQIVPLIDKRRFHTIRIAVSYVMNSGVEFLLPKLRSFIEAGGKIKVLFGDDFEISQGTALEQLHLSNAELRLFVGDMNYHPKVWLFEGEDESISIIGSSNLSKPAFTTNIEANVLVDNRDFVNEQIDFFKCLWDDYGWPIDEDWIDHYKDREQAEKSDIKYKPDGTPDVKSNLGQIRRFVQSWQKYIKRPRKRGPSEYWRGWYFAPEPATFNDSKLVDLQNVTAAILDSSDYKRKGKVALSPRYTDHIIRTANVTYEGRPMTRTEEGRRALFIRQHKNYLEKLGLLKIIDRRGPIIEITERGQRLTKAGTKEARQRIFTEAAQDFRWAWAPKLNMVRFIFQLLRSLPGNRVYFHEMSFLCIHADHPKMFESMKRLIRMFRELPNKEKVTFIRQTERIMTRDLKKKGIRAFEHYQEKVVELMRSLGYIRGIRFYEDRMNYAKSYLELA